MDDRPLSDDDLTKDDYADASGGLSIQEFLEGAGPGS
jgi:hypothetical protein